MKIKVVDMPYRQVMALPRPQRPKPLRPSPLIRGLLYAVSAPELRQVGFTHTTEDMDRLGEGPCLILMNHSSFIDLKIAVKLFFPRPLSIVCTTDGFVGKSGLMRALGCIPTHKFVSDVGLIGQMRYALEELGCSVLMYPEASYSFDGTATPLPRKLGVLLKKLKVPVVTVITSGAFTRQPLYNCLHRHDTPVSAHVRCLLTPEDIARHSVPELDAMLDAAFTFDQFAWQYRQQVAMTAPNRAEGLHRILYRCPVCGREDGMEGKGTTLTCHCCGKTYAMTPYGRLEALEGETEFAHIPDWYAWQRQCVRRELEEGSYRLDLPVDIAVVADHRAVYRVGEGRLQHDAGGFTLTGCGGQLHYTQSPLYSYSLYADYYWYELGDVICLGDLETQYCCFPRSPHPVAKTRLAVEELYRMKKPSRRREAVES